MRVDDEGKIVQICTKPNVYEDEDEEDDETAREKKDTYVAVGQAGDR